MTLDNCIKRYETWASDDRISPVIREEHKQVAEWLNSYKKLLEQEPCDCISREDALQALCKAVHKNDDAIPCLNQRVSCLWDKTKVQDYAEEILKLHPVTPKATECEDAISRQTVLDILKDKWNIFSDANDAIQESIDTIETLRPVTPKQKTGHCKECKYFEYDSIAKVDGIPLIVAHEICKKWGDGCKTSEDGYCFLFEPQESEEAE